MTKLRNRMVSTGYAEADSKAADAPVPLDDTTAGTTLLYARVDDGQLMVANVGDSRAVLCHKGQAIPLSRDHKPELTDEKQRIQKVGGNVDYLGETAAGKQIYRVERQLAMSRCIGHPQLKAKGVSAEPEITVHQLRDGDEFLLLASDGVWDSMSNAEACDLARCASGGQDAVDTIIRHSNCGDNATVILIDLRSFAPAPSLLSAVDGRRT